MEIPHFPQNKTNTQNLLSLCSLLANQVLLKEDQKSLKLYTITSNSSKNVNYLLYLLVGSEDG